MSGEVFGTGGASCPDYRVPSGGKKAGSGQSDSLAGTGDEECRLGMSPIAIPTRGPGNAKGREAFGPRPGRTPAIIRYGRWKNFLVRQLISLEVDISARGIEDDNPL